MAIIGSNFARMVATVGGIGYAPFMPGTWASAAALPVAWGLYHLGGALLLALATLFVFALGVWASDVTTRETGEDDPRWIVVDEIAGMWLVLTVVPPDIVLYLIGFVLFRITDVFKPWPASWADRTLPGGIGVMVDDIFAAGWSALILIIFYYTWFL